MNAKKYLVAAIVLNSVLLVVAASLWQTKRGAIDAKPAVLAGAVGKFGPVVERVLPPAKTETSVEILDLETGHGLLQPPFEYFNSRADAIMAWIHSNRLDISCSSWSGGTACVTYDMTVVPVEGRCWEQTTEEELVDNPALAPVPHSPRRLLVLRPNRPNTYMFRTGEGTLGMFRIVDLRQLGGGVKICYKLINPARSVAAENRSSRNT